MAEMWYYTTDGKQMDPVPIAELQRLAGEGTLKPPWSEADNRAQSVPPARGDLKSRPGPLAKRLSRSAAPRWQHILHHDAV